MVLPPVALAVLLLMLAVALAAPVSSVLAQASWPRRVPVAGLVLWQAVCLAAGLAAIGAGVVLAVEPLGDDLPSALGRWLADFWHGRPLAGMSAVGIVAGIAALLMAALLLAVLLRCAWLAGQRRRAHRQVLDLLTAPGRAAREAGPDVLDGIRILDHHEAVAYTLPGWHCQVVLSMGMVDLLPSEELAGVIEHERAHVRSRHDVLVLPFQAWAAALGAIPGVRAAAGAVAELVEMHSDDLATRRVAPAALARALARVALTRIPKSVSAGDGGIPAARASVGSHSAEVPGAATGVLTTAVGRRVDRLRCSTTGHDRALATVVNLAAVLLLAVPTILLFIGWR